MRRPPKLDPLAAFVRFLDVMIRAEITYEASRRVLLRCGKRFDASREAFAVFNPQLFGRARGATSKDSGH